MSILSSQEQIALRESFERAGQGHVFRYWDTLDAACRERLLEQAAQVDLVELAELVQTLVLGEGGAKVDFEALRPAPHIPLPQAGGDALRWKEAREVGEAALRAGRVGAFTVAGGQGTRLGYDGPKGTFGVTPVRGKSLFQVFAEKLRHAAKHYGKEIPWYIMTSHINHEATVAFFKAHGYFGMRPESVFFFRQGLMPAVGGDGRILMESRHSIAMSPDGHGGSLRALVRSGAVADMEQRGVDILSYFQVDNPLVRCVDPEFVGFHCLAGSEMSSKMLPKAYPEEKVGHFCVLGEQTVVIEYSDMPEALARRRGSDGQLLFRSGSIAIHMLDRAFIKRLGGGQDTAKLPFHRADKKIACLDDAGQPVSPKTANGVKFEMFVFDALPFARHPVIIETAREDDFSPVKNAEGVDSAQTCRDDQLRQFARWIRQAGLPLECDATGRPPFALEISPLFAVDAEGFRARWEALASKPALADGLYLES